MKVTKYRDRWLRQHTQYEKIAYKLLMSGFRGLGNSIPFELMTEDNYKDLINTNFNQTKFINIYFDIYKEVGVIHGKRVGRSINKQAKDFSLFGFLSLFESELLGWLFANALERVITVRANFLKYLTNVIAEGVAEGKTISQIATETEKQVNEKNFYRWQALRIARTETTAAANHAAIQAGESSNLVLDKTWISAIDNKTRKPPKSEFNHLVMNGVKVGKDEVFEVPDNGGVQRMQFPGDPKGSAGNVINCRCTVALVPRRDKDGRIIRK